MLPPLVPIRPLAELLPALVFSGDSISLCARGWPECCNYRRDSTQLSVLLWRHWIPSASGPGLITLLSSCVPSFSGLFVLSVCLLLCTVASLALLDSRVASCWAQSQGWSSEVSSFFIGSLVHPSQGSPGLLLLSTASSSHSSLKMVSVPGGILCLIREG